MSKSHTFLAIVLITIIGATNLKAQDAGPIGVGIRGTPDGGGLTAKFFLNENVAIEAQINGSGGTYNDNGPSVTTGILLEYNFYLNDPSWRIFLGPGAHVGRWKRYGEWSNTGAEAVYGFDVIGSVEYVFSSVPIGISIDIKPSMNFISGITMFPNNTFGLSFRYYFGNWRHADTPPPSETH